MVDNKRYIGDVFIDGKTDRLLQEFLTNLFNQYNGEGKGFNADMLDGHHYSEIEGEIARLDSEKLSSLVIGNSVFNADNATGYLHFSDIIYDDYTALPWKQNVPTNYNITQTLTDLFQYIDTLMQGRDNLKVDKEQVNPNDDSPVPRMKVLSDNNFTDTDKNNLSRMSSSMMDKIIDYQDEHGKTHPAFDSDLTNGLRFILITQEDYDGYKNSEDEDERAFIDSWRNIFIIKDEEDMPDDQEYENPLSYPLKDGYKFRLANDEQQAPSDLNQIDSESDDPVWLQYKHNWSSNWTNIAPLEDFLFGANFDGIIQTYLEGYDNYKIHETSLLNSLKDITQSNIDSNWSDYPFLSSTLHNDYVKYIKFNGQNSYITSSIDTSQFKTVDINLTQLLKDYKVLNSNGTNNILSISNKVSDNQSSIRSLQTDMSSVKQTNTTQDSNISALQTSVSSLRDRITPLESKVNKNFRLLERHEDGAYYDIKLYTNDAICYVTVRWNMGLLRNQPYSWEIPLSISEWPVAPAVVVSDKNAWYRPLYPVSFLDLSGHVMFVVRDNDGRLYHKSMTGRVITSGEYWASATYVPRGLLG